MFECHVFPHLLGPKCKWSSCYVHDIVGIPAWQGKNNAKWELQNHECVLVVCTQMDDTKVPPDALYLAVISSTIKKEAGIYFFHGKQ